MKKYPTTALVAAAALVLAASVTPAFAAKPRRLQPTRIHSLGDSITTAFDSNLLGENPSESWANGSYGFWQRYFGLENVNSHNQRADKAFRVRSNVNGGRNGADMGNMEGQAQLALATTPYYVPIELGGNDVCRDSASEVPAPIDYALDYLDGIAVLDPSIWGRSGGLTPGATVYTASIPDIKQLYDVGKDETGIFGIDCETIWATTLIGFPCGSMLSPRNTEEDRLALQSINYQYNQMLAYLTTLANTSSQKIYWDYTWSVWDYQVQGSDISAIDCFHPSSEGQRRLSEGTWIDGPFAAF